MPIAELHAQPGLKDMVTLRPGNRLSITPVSPAEWKLICSRLR
jgi:predicted RNA-binding protein with PUA-like domain